MQYPEIQFYRGSLVRLATGQLKQVEDLSSDDFIESARLAVNSPSSAGGGGGGASKSLGRNQKQHQQQLNQNCNNQTNRLRFDFNPLSTGHLTRAGHGHNGSMAGSSGTLDENNNSVFNSPEPGSSCFDDSPRMKTDDCEDEDEEIDVELDVVTTHDDDHEKRLLSGAPDSNNQRGLNLSSRNHHQFHGGGGGGGLQQVKLEPLSSGSSSTMTPFSVGSKMEEEANQSSAANELGQDFYLDSSVVRDFLEVGPIQQQASGVHNNQRLPASTSPASSTNSLNNQEHAHSQPHSLPSTSTSSSSSSSNSLQSSISPPVAMPQILSTASSHTDQTVLIKFFLETSRSVVFIEVPIEHPFFVFHRGWSSWNPQRTYDKFGLKCRKLKIGDTCISLIRRKQNPNHQDSDQCNILFSSIKINE